MINLSTMPKAELHLHLEGAPPWASVRAAHQRHYRTELPEIPHWYVPNFRFTHFSEFQALFQHYIHPWLQTPSGYAEITHDVIESLIEQNIRYAEINVAVSMAQRHGACLEQLWETLAVEAERAKTHHCVVRFFVGLMRNHGVEEAIAWVHKTRSVDIVAGFDLQGDEVNWPADQFQAAFELAREAGKRVKVHAGEMTGPESIRIAVEQLGITQIGHGTSAIRDLEVVALLRDRHVTVEMCPTSNERLSNIASYSQHPIFELDTAGIAVTVNSDDPTFFGHNLTDEFARLIEERQASPTDLQRWTQNAFSIAMLDDQTRNHLMAELKNWASQEMG